MLVSLIHRVYTGTGGNDGTSWGGSEQNRDQALDHPHNEALAVRTRDPVEDTNLIVV